MNFISEKRLNKLRFYARAFGQQVLVPNSLCRLRLNRIIEGGKKYDPELIEKRVEYYNKLNKPFPLTSAACSLGDLSPSKQSAYYYDLYSILRYFSPELRFDYEFGDVRVIKDEPSLVKSRPIAERNENNVLLRLNQVRHFLPIEDATPFREKKNLMVWRGAGWQQTRRDFLKEYWNHPLLDVGQVNPPCDIVPPEHVKPKMTIDEQLQYKFILSLEGTDVATNLKWIAQSNSLCFMRKPRMESWFMEGCLEAGVHYVELREDYADMGEKIEFYIAHPVAAEEMIQNFKAYYRQFMDPLKERLIALKVMRKYFTLSGQLRDI